MSFNEIYQDLYQDANSLSGKSVILFSVGNAPEKLFNIRSVLEAEGFEVVTALGNENGRDTVWNMVDSSAQNGAAVLCRLYGIKTFLLLGEDKVIYKVDSTTGEAFWFGLLVEAHRPSTDNQLYSFNIDGDYAYVNKSH